MKAAHEPQQRHPDAKLLVIDSHGGLRSVQRTELARLLRPGDLVVANDAATIPASLRGRHEASGKSLELRLAGREAVGTRGVREFKAIVFGDGDHRTKTEQRTDAPPLRAGDRLTLGPLRATVRAVLGHPRFVSIRFHGTPEEIWDGIVRHGKPVQYAHVREPLALWDVWTRIAAVPVAFEPPSAGFVLDWKLLDELHRRGVRFVTLTHAAGLSSTGDPELDARLPFDEPYSIPRRTAEAIEETRRAGGRIVALGTTVTRALEHAGREGDGVRAGTGVATQRIGEHSRLRVVDAIVSGAHEPGESHYELLHAFTDDRVLARASRFLDGHGYRAHEFGDSILLERSSGRRIPVPTSLGWQPTPLGFDTR